MAMPQHLVFIRHGQSEGNIVQRAFREGAGMEVPSTFIDTHDWQYRLSPDGVEQAEAAGQWLRENVGPVESYFDERFVSPYIRTRETALHIGGLSCSWLIDDRLPERDWGIYNSVHPSERHTAFPHTEQIRKLSSLRWRPDGGESLTGEVLLRFRDWLDTLHREQSGRRVLAVTHGELMWMARYVIERMLPEEWEAADKDASQRIFNCDILWYTRTNPADPTDVNKYLKWRRIIRPTGQGTAPFDGEWVELPGKRYFSGRELANMVNEVPRMFERTTDGEV
jgi:broad specificity phosphatase PhoE